MMKYNLLIAAAPAVSYKVTVKTWEDPPPGKGLIELTIGGVFDAGEGVGVVTCTVVVDDELPLASAATTP
jgi:hypothetical protein